MKSQTATRERRLHKDGMDEYVFKPSSDYARAFALVGFAFGCLGVALWLVTIPVVPLAVLFFLVFTTSLTGGFGWMWMIEQRLRAYKSDIMDRTTVDKNDELDYMPHVPGEKRIPLTANGVTRDVEVAHMNPLTGNEWVGVAVAVRRNGVSISEKGLCRDNSILSQPKYSQCRSYLRQNNYIKVVSGQNELTDAGERYLDKWITPNG